MFYVRDDFGTVNKVFKTLDAALCAAKSRGKMFREGKVPASMQWAIPKGGKAPVGFTNNVYVTKTRNPKNPARSAVAYCTATSCQIIKRSRGGIDMKRVDPACGQSNKSRVGGVRTRKGRCARWSKGRKRCLKRMG